MFRDISGSTLEQKSVVTRELKDLLKSVDNTVLKQFLDFDNKTWSELSNLLSILVEALKREDFWNSFESVESKRDFILNMENWVLKVPYTLNIERMDLLEKRLFASAFHSLITLKAFIKSEL